MTVTVDAATEHIRNDDPDLYNHGGAASGVKGVIVGFAQLNTASDLVTAVTYGGSALARLVSATDTASEVGRAELWFLGSAVPQGTQEVSITGAGSAIAWSTTVTLLADDDLESIDTDGLSQNQTNPSVTLNYASRSAMAFATLFSGHNSESSVTPNANCTTVHSASDGSRSVFVIRQTTAGTSDFAIGVTAALEDCAFAAAAISEVAAANWTLAVDTASFDVDGQAITLNKTWSTDVTKADLQPAPASLVLNQSAVLTQADFQPSGQDIVLTWVDNWTLAVDSAAIQPAGQDITLTWTQNWSLAVDKADLQPTGQDITLLASGDTPVTVDSAAFSLSGSAVDLVWTTNVQEQVYSGGWVESAYQKRYAELNDQIRRELEEEQEREELAERLERVLVKEGTLTQAQADLIRLRGLADKYNRDDLPNRARRALAFAERAKSELSAKLALREIRRVEEEEEYAVLLLMALD